MVPSSTKLLELGCATGFMSAYFSNTLGCTVYGVDLNKSAIKQATKHCHKAFSLDLDHQTSWNQIKKLGKFDVVFASAVLEHLKDPWLAMTQIHQLLKSTGTLIITLPNIAHWSIRLSLLKGEWQYQRYGILDNTHLRFFTYHTAQNLVTSTGFKIIDIQIDPAGGIKYFNHIARRFPNFYAHQIAIKAIKN